MSEPGHGLEALRGLHIAASASPDPYVWLAICAGLLLALCLAVVMPADLFRMRRLRRELRRALAATQHTAQDDRLTEQAIVLRRLARTLGGDDKLALRGEAWLGALDHWFRTDYFTRGEGRCFAEDLYRSDPNCDPERTLEHLQQLAGRLRR